MKTKTQKKRRAPRASGETKKTARSLGRQKKSNVTGPYLVIWRHTMDDVPVGLFSTLPAALDAAKSMSFRADYTVAKKLDIDCRTPVCFAVIEFDKGKPTEMLVIDRADDA